MDAIEIVMKEYAAQEVTLATTDQQSIIEKLEARIKELETSINTP